MSCFCVLGDCIVVIGRRSGTTKSCVQVYIKSQYVECKIRVLHGRSVEGRVTNSLINVLNKHAIKCIMKG